MARKLSLIIIMLLSFVHLKAQDFQFLPDEKSERIYSYNLIANLSYKPNNVYTDSLPENKDNEYDDLVASPSRTDMFAKSIQDYVLVGVNHDTNVVATAYSYTISLRIWCFDYNSPGSPSHKDIDMRFNYNPDSGKSYIDANVFKFTGFHKILVEVKDVKDDSTGSTVLRSQLPKNFYVMSTVSLQRYDTQPFSIYSSADLSTDGKTLHINWKPSTGSYSSCTNPSSVTEYNLKPVEYELEWTYIDNYSYNAYSSLTGSSSTSFSSGSTIDYDFRKNNSKVRLSQKSYDIPLIYEHGAIVYRIRAVRPDYSNNYKTILYEGWTQPDYGSVSLSDACKAFFISNAHTDDSLNWQYTINFAEQGKYKHVINYFDGSLRNRQTQTKINTDSNYVIAVDKTYDYEGHVSIQTLPTPVQQNFLRYLPSVSLNAGTSSPYKAADFDNLSCSTPDSIPPLSSSALARLYYSSSNPDKTGYQKFVPDAGGYPFIQSIYSPDNLLLWQSGAGYNQQLWLNRGTRYEYMRASQPELDQLFGDQVGKCEFYPKQVITDPNGQSSFIIQNMRGQTVATGLIGMVDTVNMPIDILPASDTGKQDCFDILANVSQDASSSTLSVSNTFYAEKNGFHSLQYRAKVQPFPIGCGSKYLWPKTYYSFEGSNDCGVDVISTHSGVLGTDSVLSTNTPEYVSSPTVSQWLVKGKYMASKTLSFSRDDINVQIRNFVSSHEDNSSDCYHDVKYFVRNVVESTNFPCVDSGDIDPCEKKRKQMIADLWPNAKYGQYEKNTDSSFKYDFTDSAYIYEYSCHPYYIPSDFYAYPRNENSIFAGFFYCNPVYPADICYCADSVIARYQMPCLHLPDTVIKNGRVYTNLRELPVDTFIYIFNDTIAEALLPLHPEYCKLGLCADDSITNQLESFESYKQAVIGNRFYLDSIIQHDPIYYKADISDRPQIKHTLSHFRNFSLKTLDQLAIEKAYCDAGNAFESLHSSKYLYAYQIQNFVFVDSNVKQKYYEFLRGYYLANRSLIKQQALDLLSSSCSPCADARIGAVIGDPIFPPVFTSVNSFDTSVHLPDWIADIYSNAFDSTADHSTLNPPPSQITDSMNAARQLMCSSQVDYIMRKLINCSLDTSKLNIIRANLAAHCGTTGGVDQLTPQAIASAITTGTGLSLNDLCHPFLMETNTFDNSSEIEPTYDCAKPEIYDGLKNLLSRSAMTNSMKNATYTGSSVSTFSLSGTTNPYEDKIASYLGVSNTATVSAQGKLDTMHFINPANSSDSAITKIIQIKVFAGGADTFRLYVKGKFLTTPELDTASSIGIDTAFCLNDDIELANDGYVAQYTSVVDMTVNATAPSKRYIVWSNGIPIMKPVVDGDMLKCITCIDINNAVADFKSDKTTWGYDDAYNHPFFASTLTNYLNYKLNKKYNYVDYLSLMKGCALSDVNTLNRHFATIEVECTNDGDANSFLAAVEGFTLRDVIETRIKHSSTGNTIFAVDLTAVPEDSMLLYVYTIDSIAASLHITPVYLADHPLRVYTSTSCSPSTSLSSYDPHFSTESVNVFINGSALPYHQYEFTGSYANDKDNADMIINYIAYGKQCAGSFVTADAALLRSEDYLKPDKQNYLAYVYSLSGHTRYELADSIAAANLKARVSGYAGNTVSYDDPYCSKGRKDLYLYGVNTTHPGYKRLKDTVIGAVASSLGGGLFMSSGTLSYNISSSLNAYKKVNGIYWYRYFSPDNTLYNVHLQPPANPPFDISSLVYDSVKVGPGIDSVYRFTAYMHYSTVPSEVVTCKGYTDFPVGYGRKVQDVVLYEKPGLNNCLDSIDCEYGVLQDAIYAGKVQYQFYYDSVTTTLTDSMLYFVVNHTKDSLFLCSQSMKNQITLYHYDLAGNLVKTIPPAGYDRAFPYNIYKQNNYKFNSRNELYYQNTIDGGTTNFFYDELGKVVFSQNSKQSPDSNFSYTLYDKQHRIIETGEVMLPCGGDCDYVNNLYRNPMDSIIKYIRTKVRHDVVRTYYDDMTKDLSLEAGYNLSTQENLIGRVSAILYYDSKGYDYDSVTVAQPNFGTYYSYDMMGNVKTVTYECMAMEHLRQLYKRVDYDYDQVSGKINMLSYNRGRADQTYHRYSYDADNRITQTETSLDGIIWNRDAAYTYYKHGPLANVKIGDDQLQSIEYAYTIEGWLKAINGDVLRPDKDMGGNGASGDHSYARDVMAMALHYYNHDYTPIDNAATVTYLSNPAKNLYNGNIVAQTLSQNTFGSLRRNYQYDQVQRLTDARYAAVNESNLTIASPSNIYRNSYAYDPDGNINKLVRYNGAGALMDSLLYSYQPYTDMLTYVNEKCAATTAAPHDIKPAPYVISDSINYHYDEIGNMVRDIYGNQQIDWNLYGKVRSIVDTANEDEIDYEYDGMGNRVLKEVITSPDTSIELHTGEYYVRDATGNLLSTYEFKSNYSPYLIIQAANDGLHTNSAFIPFLLTHVDGYGDFADEFADQAIANEGAWVTTYTNKDLGVYISHSNDIYNRFIFTDQSYMDDLQAYDITNSSFPVPPPSYAHVYAKSFVLNGSTSANILSAVLDQSGEATRMLGIYDYYLDPSITSMVWGGLGLTYTPFDTAANAAAMYSYMMGTTPPDKAGVLAALMNGIDQDIMGMMGGSELFYNGIVTDNYIFKSTNLRNTSAPLSSFEYAMADALYHHGEFSQIQNFAHYWTGGNAWLTSNTTLHERVVALYGGDKTGTLNDFITNATTYASCIDHAIAYTNKLKALNYVRWIKKDPVLGPLTTIDRYTGIAADTLSLTEQHLYGSSRLGIQYRFADSVVNTYNIDTSIAAVNKLDVKLPWYSYIYGDLIDSNSTEPWGHTDSASYNVTRRLGWRWYDITDHLGNVMAEVMDRKSGHKINSGDTLYDYWQPNLADLADFYPYGMKMPDRLLDADSTNKYGYNGQRQEQDLYKSINPRLGKYGIHYTALFWEYDPLRAWRMNRDSKPTIGISEYSVFGGNPIWRNDILGDEFKNGNTALKEAAKTRLDNASARLNEAKGNTDISKRSLRKLERQLKDATNEYNLQVQYEQISNDVINEFKGKNPSEFERWNHLKDAYGKEVDIPVTVQTDKIVMIGENGLPTGQVTTEGTMYRGAEDGRGNRYIMSVQSTLVYPSLSTGKTIVISVTSDMVHGLGHADVFLKKGKTGENETEDAANEYERKTYNHGNGPTK
ncbi:MAG: hypothetical protein JST82_13875 [Bacteroidetes bacterium]|nr:hypothetical protein [Bacteroidota bacterium]